MRNAINQALVTLIALIAMLVAFVSATYIYYVPYPHFFVSLTFVAGALALAAQALLAGLAYWGLLLARQQADLASGPDLSTTPSLGTSSFKMSYGDDAPVAPPNLPGAPEARTLDIGFQRVVIALSAIVVLILAGVIAYLTVTTFRANTRPGQTYIFADFKPLAAVIALGAATAYFALLRFTRPTRETGAYADAVHGILTMGFPGIVAVAVAVLAECGGLRFGAEISAGIVAFLLVLQAVELLVNAARSYAAIEEIDQPPVDLTALPLVPMLSGIWLSAVQSLIAQSLGLTRYTADSPAQPTIVSRMMPRVLIALAILLFLVTTLRTVNAGEVAVLERLGHAQTEPDPDHPGQSRLLLLQPGLHFTLPWPIDELVHIPTQTVQQITVGTEEAPLKINDKPLPVDFAFWSFRHSRGTGGLDEPDVITGDQQLVGTLASVWWRVRNPADFYNNISHSEFYETERKSDKPETVAKPIYEALVQAMATQAVTASFAQHPLNAIMETDRHEVEEHCRAILQQDLNALHSGIEIVDFTIREVHPPIGNFEGGVRETPTGPEYGPARAYENVVAKREEKDQRINEANADKVATVNGAQADAARVIHEAQAYQKRVVEAAHGEVNRQLVTAPQYAKDPELSRTWLIYKSVGEVISNPQVIKIILGHDVVAPEIIQPNKEGTTTLRPPGTPGP